MPSVELGLVAIGFFLAGFVDSIGGGGGLISLPVLLAFGLPPATALGTNKLCSGFGTTVATVQYWRKGLVIPRLVAIAALFVLVGGALGAYGVQQIPAHTLHVCILILLPIAALVGLLPRPEHYQMPQLHTTDFWICVPSLATAMGAYDGGFGPGAGTLVILGMNYWLKMPLLQASANAKVMNLMSNLAAFGSFAMGGHVNYRLGGFLVGFSMAGNWIGSRVAMRFGNRLVQQVIRVVLLGLVITVVVRTVGFL